MPEGLDAAALRAHLQNAIARIDKDVQSIGCALRDLEREEHLVKTRRELLATVLTLPDEVLDQLIDDFGYARGAPAGSGGEVPF